MVNTTMENDYLAVGVLAAHTGRTVRDVEAAARRLKIRPSMTINMVPHYNGPAATAITSELRGSK